MHAHSGRIIAQTGQDSSFRGVLMGHAVAGGVQHRSRSGGLVSVGDGGGTDSVCGLVSGPNVRVSCIKYPLDCAHSRIFATL